MAPGAVPTSLRPPVRPQAAGRRSRDASGRKPRIHGPLQRLATTPGKKSGPMARRSHQRLQAHHPTQAVISLSAAAPTSRVRPE